MENRRPSNGNGGGYRGYGRGGGMKRPYDDDGNGGREDRQDGRATRGRGGGSGRGRGGRGRKTFEERRQERLDQHDLVVIRQDKKMDKRGDTGKMVRLLANYFLVEKKSDWAIYHYRVDFLPDEEDTRIKKNLLRSQQDRLPPYIFDGSSLWISARLSPDPYLLTSENVQTGRKVQVSIRLVSELAPVDVMYLQIYNIMVRKCLEFMELEELGRHFYDRHQAIPIHAYKLEVWPGYKTSMRNHENDLLLCVEMTHKVLRTDNVLISMREMGQGYGGGGGFRDRYGGGGGGGDFNREAIKRDLVGSIIMTHYNRKTYRVDDIDWSKTPYDTFDTKEGGAVSFADYFATKHNLRVTDRDQPLLVSRPQKKDYHRGQTGPILLVPEFCQMTGLTDEQRGNFQLMRALAQHLHIGPQQRVEEITKFMRRLQNNPAAQEDMNRWGLQFSSDLVNLPGRVVAKEKIFFGGGANMEPSGEADWNNAFKSRFRMLSSIPLDCWVIIIPQRDAGGFDRFVDQMNQVGSPLAFNMGRPTEVMRIPDIRIPSYLTAIDQAMRNYGDKLQLFFIVLPKIAKDIYGAVKKKCAVEYGVPSQCFVVKNAGKGMSVATKVVIQLNAKLGGEPWSVAVPLKKLMIVGFDVHHATNRKNKSVGAIVATTTPTHARYYSTVSFHHSKEELSSNLTTDFTKCIYAFEKVNQGDFPDRIIMYRDGVGEGQLSYVFDTELRQVQSAMEQLYREKERPLPKFTFIVVSKKINTRIFLDNRGNASNPEPGTIVDDVITLPERFDFYLISQFSRQGTVSPASYNVLIDQQGIGVDKLQRLTYKLCHTYFNWSGTVTVPSPCQYAHKLAYLTGLALQGEGPSELLSHNLHFL